MRIFAALFYPLKALVPSPNVDIAAQVAVLFGNRLRVRACGLLRQNDQLLLINHRGLSQSGTFWSPPGGGVEFGETAPIALKREFAEETGLIVDVGRLLFVYEFMALPLHAIDLFFDVHWVGGVLQTGADPEMSATEQTIAEARFMHYDDINALPVTDVHALVGGCKSLDELLRQTGYFNQL